MAAVSETARAPRRRFRDLPRWGRWTTYVVVALVLVLVAAGVGAVLTVRRSFPDLDGTVRLPGLDGEVTVLRDGYGVPQIYADTSDDLFYAQGYVQAQDRFFEMDVRRHITAGRLSEMFGADTLDTDKAIRVMGWRRVAEREVALLSPDTLRALESFSAGVNAYIRDHTPGEMSLEYTLLAASGLDYQVEDWTPVDSVSWLKAIAWDLRTNMDQEVERALLSARLVPDKVAQLFPPYPYARHRPILEQGAVVAGRFDQDARPRFSPVLPIPAGADGAFASVARAVAAVPPLVGSGEGIGSNGWVVDGEHSKTGMPILANDPHLAPALPSVWYQSGLHCREVTAACPYDVAGFSFAGLPGVVIGHNQQIAWGFTNLGPDVTDLYLEKLRGTRYLYRGRYRDLQSRDETIEIAGERPFTFSVRRTRHGPLLSDVSEELSTVGANAPVDDDGAPARGNGYAVALAWSALRPSPTADALFEINRATDWASFRAAASKFAAPSQNMVYADRDGHIGYQAPGLIPVRRPGHTGEWPVAGWTGRDDWRGFIPFEALPTAVDPDEGFFATANQPVVGPGYAYRLGEPEAFGYRSQRIVDILRKRGTLSVDDMAEIQLDTRNGFAPDLVPYLLDVDLGSAYYRVAQRLLRGWDFTQPADSAPAAYYNAVWRQVLARTFHDQVPEDTWPEGGDRWFEVVRGLLDRPNSEWWDDVDTTDVRESRDDILEQAMKDARDELVRLQARRPQEWTWGHQHVLDLENQTVGQSDVGLVRRLLNRGGLQVGGGTSIVDATGWTAAEGYDVDWVPSMRMVVSMRDLDESTWVNLTGASGHAFHPNYTDQTELWASGRTRAWPFTRAAVEDAAAHTLTLEPAGQ